jgi:hypothetical protein
MILNNNDLDKAYIKDEAKGTISNINTKRVKWNTSSYNTLVTLKLILELIKPIAASSL